MAERVPLVLVAKVGMGVELHHAKRLVLGEQGVDGPQRDGVLAAEQHRDATAGQRGCDALRDAMQHRFRVG